MTSANLDNVDSTETPISSSPPVSNSPSLVNSIDHEKSGSPNHTLISDQPSSSSSPQLTEQSDARPEINEEELHEEEILDDQRPSTSPKPRNQDDSKRPMDPNAVPPSKPQSNTTTEERTSELIKKQMNEIEKEISRRMQNQNIRKVTFLTNFNF